MHHSILLLSSKALGVVPALARRAGLVFADRAVKMTRAASPGDSFTCTSSLLSCCAPGASALVALGHDETGRVPVAQVQLTGMTAVSLFRANRLVFHCAGDAGRMQRHELPLKRGDVLALLGGHDLTRDWGSVSRTMRRVSHEDLEYITEEMLLELMDAESCHNGICVMTVVHDRPSGLVPQPPQSLQSATM